MTEKKVKSIERDKIVVAITALHETNSLKRDIDTTNRILDLMTKNIE